MPQKKRLTDRLQQQLQALEQNRSGLDEYTFNFILNMGQYAAVMHQQLAAKLSAASLQVACSQYVSALISCWETYFRDAFGFLVTLDPILRERTLTLLRLTATEVVNIESRTPLGPYLAKCFNFQLLEEITDAFYPVFDQDILELSASHSFVTYISRQNKECLFRIETAFPEYKQLLKGTYMWRHESTHDANYDRNHTVNRPLVQQAETLFLLVPQVITQLLAHRYQLPSIMLHTNEQQYPYIILVEDLLANDWQIVD